MCNQQSVKHYTLKFQKGIEFKALEVDDYMDEGFLDTVLTCITDMYKRGFCLISITQEELQ